ncbi:MAG: uracil-DNA glycosylase [Phyllobacteriaceae bacterium]|nr:uracil-DNA glycosylase [Phyllobacteriaceae bacterium]
MEPHRDCSLCPRLKAYIDTFRVTQPDWHNAPLPVFGDAEERVRLLVVGLAPGLKGANRTGRNFTGDHAGELLYQTLLKHGFARGTYGARPDDGLTMHRASIINAVRCVPPQNKPTPDEINTCRQFLTPAFGIYQNLTTIITLGAIAHYSTVRALGQRVAVAPFSHGGETQIGSYTVLSSYHCSRYNTNTGVLTEAMFDAVFARAAVLTA